MDGYQIVSEAIDQSIKKGSYKVKSLPKNKIGDSDIGVQGDITYQDVKKSLDSIIKNPKVDKDLQLHSDMKTVPLKDIEDQMGD